MPLTWFTTAAVVFGGGYLVYKVARKLWRKADVKEKQDELEALHENYDNVRGINTGKIQKERQKVKDVLGS